MTQKEQSRKIAELHTLFLSLNDEGQERALAMLRALESAQSMADSTREEPFGFCQ